MPALHQKYIIDDKGKKSAVVLPIAEYNDLMEDMHDLTVIAERKKETSISFAELKKRLK